MTYGARNAGPTQELEKRYRELIQTPLSEVEEMGQADVVVGIPFYNEVDTLPHVISVATQGLHKSYPDKKCVVVAVGSPAGAEALGAINSLPADEKVARIAFLLDDEQVSGKGWGIRAIMEIARSLSADLAILEADLLTSSESGDILDGNLAEHGGEPGGLTPDWIGLLLEPIKREDMDLVISRFSRHHLEFPLIGHLTYPLIAAIYGHPIGDVVGGEWGISSRLVGTYLQEASRIWNGDIGGYGIDVWMATVAVREGMKVCESNLGAKLCRHSPAKEEVIFPQVARVLFECIVADRSWWEGRGEALVPLPAYGLRSGMPRGRMELPASTLLSRYWQGYNKFNGLYQRILPAEVCQRLEGLAGGRPKGFNFPPRLWAQIVYRILSVFAFSEEYDPQDLINSLGPLCSGRDASSVLDIQFLRAKLKSSLADDEVEQILSMEATRQSEEQVEEFLRERPAFFAEWEGREEAVKPALPKVTYREFIPGVPLVVPWEITTAGGDVVTARGIYRSVFDRYREQFEYFVHERLGVPREANSAEVAQAVREFMHQVEREVDKLLLPGDPHTVRGVREVVEGVFRNFPHQETFALAPDMAQWLLYQHQPRTLLTRLRYGSLGEMLQEYEPNDILALASWSEERAYVESLWNLIVDEIRVEHFALSSLEPLAVSHEEFPSLVEMKEASALDKLSGRIVVSNLHKGMGGEFTKLRYLTTISKSIVEAERFGHVWQRFAEERKEFGRKVIKSLEGHWGRVPLSAHSIFEDGNQRLLVERLKEMAQRIAAQADGDKARLRLAHDLRDVTNSYHLAITLPDGGFVPCSAWTWASYSFKGGRETPTPLSLHVERDWTSRDFLVGYFKAAGGTEEEVEDRITELMGQGRESEDLANILLGGHEWDEGLTVAERVTVPEQPSAGELTRFAGNPVLEPIGEHEWESKYVLNAGAIRLDGKIYIVYRAFGDDEISRCGLAISKDGFAIEERLDEPIFGPENDSEEKGCEDTRLTLIGDRIYMLYTAYSGYVAQVALAAIAVGDFIDRRWDRWERHGLAFPGFPDKDATLFPELFDGKYALLHRVEPNMWISFASEVHCPWPKTDHYILSGARPGMSWDGEKIGAGAQPIKTKYGWLLICHGVDYAAVYRLGVMLADLANPARLIYRSPNFILEPRLVHEVGEKGKSWVDNVVFTCGALPAEDKEVLGEDDEILVYYGAADTVLCVATARVGDLLPKEIRSLGSEQIAPIEAVAEGDQAP